jgi:DNA-binding phage protein
MYVYLEEICDSANRAFIGRALLITHDLGDMSDIAQFCPARATLEA